MRDLSTANGARLLAALEALPAQIERSSSTRPRSRRCAELFQGAEHAYFVGRAAGFAVAMEGALKLKEISYLHAEAYPASELKHGPLALIDAGDADGGRDAARRPVREERLDDRGDPARGGPVLVVTHPGEAAARRSTASFEVPKSEPELDPLLLNIPLQLLAYHVALAAGRDIDQPRNLAKSVTVE